MTEGYESAARAAFKKAASKSFDWLREYGFRQAEEGAVCVRYEGKEANVIVHLDHSCEVGVSVGPAGGRGKSFSLGLLIRVAASNDAEYYADPTALSLQAIEEGVELQSRRLMKYGTRILSGDSAIWADLEREATRAWREFEASPRLSEVLPEAERSFREQDYERVVALLSRVEAILLPDDRDRLQYARERVAQGGKRE